MAKDMRFITKNQIGFDVRFSKLNICKYFSTAKLGQAGALKAAMAYRDEIVQKYNYVNPNYRTHKRARGTRHFGGGMVAGVYLQVYTKGLAVFANFIADYKDGTQFRKRSFSVRKYGYVGAFKKALEFRTSQVGIVNTQGAPIPFPTLKQYQKIMNLAPDVPSPKV